MQRLQPLHRISKMADFKNCPIPPIFDVFRSAFLYERFLKYLLNHVWNVFVNFNR